MRARTGKSRFARRPGTNCPDAEIADGTLKVTPLTNAVPEEAEASMRQASSLLPHIKLTDVL
jgi:hypothetical protein